MIIFIAGMSRSGSMWTFNVTRELIRKSGKVPLPQSVPPDEKRLIGEAFRRVIKDNEIYCIKTHMPLRPNLPNSKIICTYRDVREAMVSYMRFMHCDFQMGLDAAKNMMSLTDYYFGEHKNNIVRIKYNRIVSEPAAVIHEINDFLGFNVRAEDFHLIAEGFSKERMRKFVETLNSVEIAGTGVILDSALRTDLETVGNLDGSFRVYDKKSAFQSHHITNAGERWRTVLSEGQQAILMNLTKDWLEKYGFHPEDDE